MVFTYAPKRDNINTDIKYDDIDVIGSIMRTTITIEDALYEEALRVANPSRPSELFSKSLQALIKQEKAKRLAALGGSMPGFKTPLRNR